MFLGNPRKFIASVTTFDELLWPPSIYWLPSCRHNVSCWELVWPRHPNLRSLVSSICGPWPSFGSVIARSFPFSCRWFGQIQDVDAFWKCFQWFLAHTGLSGLSQGIGPQTIRSCFCDVNSQLKSLRFNKSLLEQADFYIHNTRPFKMFNALNPFCKWSSSYPLLAISICL